MINKVIDSLCSEMNAYLGKRFTNVDDIVLPIGVSNSTDQTGISVKENIICCVVNIEQDTNLGSVSKGAFGNSADPSSLSRTKMVTVHLVLYSNLEHDQYLKGLSYISALLEFVQVNPILNSTNQSEDVEKINLEVLNLSISEQANLFSALGIHLKPSLVIKARIRSHTN